MGLYAHQFAKEMIASQRAIELQHDIGRRRDRNRAEDTEARLAELSLLCEALWSLLSETTGLTEAHLLARLDELDMHDGVLDGRKVHAPASCQKCQAKVPNNANICLFCSAEITTRNPFR